MNRSSVIFEKLKPMGIIVSQDLILLLSLGVSEGGKILEGLKV
jgi:hypothetical protein